MVTKIEGDLVQTTGVEGCQWLRGSCYGETVGIINGMIHNWAFTWEGGIKKVWLVGSDGKGSVLMIPVSVGKEGRNKMAINLLKLDFWVELRRVDGHCMR